MFFKFNLYPLIPHLLLSFLAFIYTSIATCNGGWYTYISTHTFTYTFTHCWLFHFISYTFLVCLYSVFISFSSLTHILFCVLFALRGCFLDVRPLKFIYLISLQKSIKRFILNSVKIVPQFFFTHTESSGDQLM